MTDQEKLKIAVDALKELNKPETWLQSFGAGGADFIRSIIKEALKKIEG